MNGIRLYAFQLGRDFLLMTHSRRVAEQLVGPDVEPPYCVAYQPQDAPEPGIDNDSEVARLKADGKWPPALSRHGA